MSTAQVANAGIVGPAVRISQPRNAVASLSEFVDPISGSYAPPAHDQARGYDDFEEFDTTPRRRRRPAGPFLDNVVSFGGVLVSREVGTTIMQAQAAHSARTPVRGGVEAERNIAIYEFNQALMRAAETSTDIGMLR